MKSIILTSHGELCKGLVNSAKMIFGSDLKQVEYLPLKENDNPELYKNALLNLIANVDNGEGVILLVDLLGGTPSNLIAELKINNLINNCDVIYGVNFPLFLEILGQRISNDYNLQNAIELAKNGIGLLNLEKTSNDDNEEEII